MHVLLFNIFQMFKKLEKDKLYFGERSTGIFFYHLLHVQAPKSWSKYTTVEHFFKKISKYTSILTALLIIYRGMVLSYNFQI